MTAQDISPIEQPDATRFLDWVGADFRPELAFPHLTEDMIGRLRPYGTEEHVRAGDLLFTYGDRVRDLFVILDGGVDTYLPLLEGGERVYGRLRTWDFVGEFNLLTTQSVAIEARATMDSLLLRIARPKLRELMRAEGDISNLIVQASIWRRIGIVKAATSGVILTGRRDDGELAQLQRFLVRNSYPYRIVEPTQSQNQLELPSVTYPDGRTVGRPTVQAIADELGITESPNAQTIYDVAVVGAGPSGLAAAVYAGSEGLKTIVIETLAPGGQAGTSSKIENYLGFPTGIGGQQLASRAHLQSLKFGVQFAISREVVSIERVGGILQLVLAGGLPVLARTVVVASGAQYRKLDLPNYSRYENQGIYYAATAMEAALCRDREVIVVGGGNSAGQAATFLASSAKHVHHIVRGPSLASTMSQYLISRIQSSSHITLHTHTEIVSLTGSPSLESVAWVNNETGARFERPIGSVFVMIGAEPNSGWLYGMVRLDSKGFIETGGAMRSENSPYATSVPGIFAIGDVRANSVKRIASAVGEGAVVISDVHRYLAEHKDRFDTETGSTLDAMRASTP
jgi:thioredoxin reductase (NADPH)